MINSIIAIVAILIVVATIGGFIKKTKSGKGGCGCGCSSCSSAGNCHSMDNIVEDLKKIK